MIACSIAVSTVHAMEIDLNEKDKLVSSLSINTIQISASTNFDYSNPSGTLVTGDVTITSPQMTGLLKVLFIDPNFSLTDQEKLNLANHIFNNLSSNLTSNGLELKAPNSENIFTITDRSGNYVGSSFGYSTQEGIINTFTLLGYGSQYQTEQQIKTMKIVRKTSSELSNLPQSALSRSSLGSLDRSCSPGDPGYPNCIDCSIGSIHYSDPECRQRSTGLLPSGLGSSLDRSCSPGDPGYPSCDNCKPGSINYPECRL